MYINRTNQSQLYQSFDTPIVTALLGQRQVGKTTLVTHYAEQHSHESWVFFNMDNREERQRVEQNALSALIQEAAQQRIGHGTKLWVLIDEAQKCPAVFDQVKLLYDKYKNQNAIKFILTGSGFLSLHQLSAESLAGRIELYYLREFGLKETAYLKQCSHLPDKSIFDLINTMITNDKVDPTVLEDYIESYAPFRPILIESLSEQLCWGGLPDALQASTIQKQLAYLSNYLQAYLEKDIRAITTISDLNLYQRLMGIIAEQTGSICQDKELIEALGCTRDTLKKYRGFLTATLVYKELYPFVERTLRRIIKTPKGYLLNNGLISYLTGINDITILKKSGLIGHRFENWFLNELQIWLDRGYKKSEIYYWRTSGGIEVDFVVEKKPFIFPFEVTYSNQIQYKKVKNLVHFMHDAQVQYGFYIYMGNFHFDTSNKIFFIPAWAIG